MKEKTYLHQCYTQYKHLSHSSMKLSSPLSYIKKNKITLKEKEKLRLNLYKNLFYSLLDRPSASDVWGIYSIEMDKEMS